MPRPPELDPALTDAIAAFDAGNLAWGRYYTYVHRRYQGPAVLPDAGPLRAALQEAALTVPTESDPAQVSEFTSSLMAAHTHTMAFLSALPDDLATGDVTLVPDAFYEAVQHLSRWRR